MERIPEVPNENGKRPSDMIGRKLVNILMHVNII
jgi:hypothetical protein